ncbi:MAG: flagellar biosynthesis protein FlhB [Planctomycetes bacterium]|nr:flagellar biosynthesis protein FlhB [Planctomycetota bacterium]
MPPDTGEKTEAPTPRRMQEAREKGQVARSMDLSAAFGLLAGLLLLNFYGENILTGFMSLTEKSLTLNETPINGWIALDIAWRTMLSHATKILLPFLLGLMVVALVGNLAQVGFMFSGQSLTPSLDKISPIKGLGRLFSKRTAMRLFMSFVKVIIISIVAYISIKGFIPELLGLSQVSYTEVVGHAAHLVFQLGLRIALVLVILAIFDYAYQRWQHLQDLRMTKEELKEELKRMEGDPIMRQRRRNVARQLAQQRMSQAVPQADVVITNPTELAIALKYDHKEMPAPKVVAMGAGFMAQRIRDLANESGIPIIERKPLAQALYKACDVGDFVPPEFYKAVAEVLAYIFELAGKGYRRKATG